MVCAKRAYNRFMAESLLNPDEKQSPDDLLQELDKVLHAAGNQEADKRIDTMSKQQLMELLQIARTLIKQRKKKKKVKEKKEEEQQEEQKQEEEGEIVEEEREILVGETQ
jgi:DNA-directed RNA polymerase beta' subunit